MFSKFRRKLPIIGIGLLILAFSIWMQLSSLPSLAGLREELNIEAYDFTLRSSLQDFPQSTTHQVIVVDIDERSIQHIGRWPWSRQIMATMLNHLRKAGASVVGFDITFSQPEINMAEALLEAAKQNPAQNKAAIQFLKSKTPRFDYDKILEKSLLDEECVLGFVFHNDTSLKNSGLLPPPIIRLNQNEAGAILVHNMLRYRANTAPFQKAAKHGGFLTIFPDQDGVRRRAPLILRYEDGIYLSLALEVMRQYLLLDKITLETEKVGHALAVSAIRLGNVRIPTDQYGQVFIPFHKKLNKRRIISALDLLNNKFDASVLKNSLVLVGSSALSLNDIHPTPVDSVYPGVFIHADILNSLLTGDFSSKPTWAPGAELTLMVLVALLCILSFPFLGAVSIIGIALLLMMGIFFGNYWLFYHEKLIISATFTLFCIGLIALVNLVYGFFFEVRHRAKLKNMFGQYVPNELVDLMNESSEHYGFEGETKTLTVLFSDIRGFTSFSENLNVVQLKELLNHFLTPITAAIFKHRGTIDKYVGDMVMAFWGAPVEDPDHAKNALYCALEMIAITETLKSEYLKQGLPPIEIGVGINTGVMSVGDMGSEFRRAYTVLGNAVNLGSRIESLSKQYGVKIAVGEATVENQEDFIFKKLDRVKVKGKLQSTEIYELICTKKEATPDLLNEIEEHEKALESYFLGDFKIALVQFLELNKKYPNQKLYALYIERIQDLISHPPEGEWTGIHEWKTK